jgi:hypothetical protein
MVPYIDADLLQGFNLSGGGAQKFTNRAYQVLSMKVWISARTLMKNHGLPAVVSGHFMLRMSRVAAPCSHPHPSRWGTLAGLESKSLFFTMPRLFVPIILAEASWRGSSACRTKGLFQSRISWVEFRL